LRALCALLAACTLTIVSSSTARAAGSCNDAAARIQAGDLTTAEELYNEPANAECREEGLAAVATARNKAEAEATAGQKLENAQLLEDAKARYVEALRLDRQNSLALDGLARIGSPPIWDAFWYQLTGLLRANALWLGLAVAFLAVWVLASAVIGWGGPQTVFVGEIANGTGDEKFTPAALAAELRARLADARYLPPPPVPTIGLGDIVAAVVPLVPSAGSGLVGLLSRAVGTGRAPADHTVSGTLSGGAPEFSFIVELARKSGQTEFLRTTSGSTPVGAIDLGANVVLAHLQAETGAPAWVRWSDKSGESMQAYQQAQEEKGNSGLRQELLNKAAALEPANLLVRIAIGGLQEDADQYIDALQTYLSAVDQWPKLVRPRYRLAAVYSFVDTWLDVWRRLPRASRLRLIDRILTMEGERPAREMDERATRAWFLDRANAEYDEVLQLLGARTRAVNEEFSTKSGSKTGLDAAVAVCQTAALCTRLQIAMVNRQTASEYAALRTRIDAIIDRRPHWQAAYNGACFYSLALADKTHEDEKVKRAIELLRVTVQEPDAATELPALVKGMLGGDPDLANLKGRPEYEAWVRYFKPVLPPATGLAALVEHLVNPLQGE